MARKVVGVGSVGIRAWVVLMEIGDGIEPLFLQAKEAQLSVLAEYCGREGFLVTLPCYRTVHKYRGKTVTFRKPLFPGYVFLQLLTHQRQKVYQSDFVANLLDVPDQESFARQLGDILLALDSDLEVRLAPQITAGSRVKIKSGPLRGLEGRVQERAGVTMVLLRLDFISQAAAVKIEATELELI